MITSDRKFGIEIEFSCPDKMSLYRIGERLNLVGDGSIRHIQHSAEYVSEILQGKAGEKVVNKSCEILKKYRASGDTSCMSVHVHLDGKKNDGQAGTSKTLDGIPSNVKRSSVYAISNRLASKMTGADITRLVMNNQTPDSSELINVTRFDSMIHLSFSTLYKQPQKNFSYYWYDRADRFQWLKNIFYFYTQYSQVMEDIVSNSRKFGNMYCIPLALSYSLDEIEACKDINELQRLWYKGRSSEGHYDDSRYHNVNLHSYWDRHGTVEIRSHGGTIDPHKILLWVKLHQKIADKLETLTIEDIKCTDNFHKNFVEFVEEPILQNYVKRLMGYYSGITIQ
jgi:hypothetical protein